MIFSCQSDLFRAATSHLKRLVELGANLSSITPFSHRLSEDVSEKIFEKYH